MFNPNDNFCAAFLVLGIICGVVGWGVIELIIWLFSFVHVSFGG